MIRKSQQNFVKLDLLLLWSAAHLVDICLLFSNIYLLLFLFFPRNAG